MLRDFKINHESVLEEFNGSEPVLPRNTRVRGYWWISDGKNFLRDLGKVPANVPLRLPWKFLDSLEGRGIKKLTIGNGKIKEGGKIYTLKVCV